MSNKKFRIFWGVTLVMAGVLLALRPADMLDWFWPLISIWLGIWIIWQMPSRQDAGDAVSESGRLALPIRGSQRIRLKIDHPAGELQIASGAASKLGLVLNYGGDLGSDVFHINGEMIINLMLGASIMPFLSPKDNIWKAALPKNVPIVLDVNAGAGQVRCLLQDLQVTRLDLKLGTGQADIFCPGQGTLTGSLDIGAGSLNIYLPPESALRIRKSSGLGLLHSAEIQLQKQGSVWQTANFDTAPNKIDLAIRLGVGQINITSVTPDESPSPPAYPALDFSQSGNQAQALIDQGLGDISLPGGSHEEN